ncbi:MAG: hypothetical protein ABIQ86_12435 [Steroidobacteraceae bacterium]
MFSKKHFVIGLITAAAALVQAPAYTADAAKDPKSGKACVTLISSEHTSTGRVQMNYRNTCATAFEIKIQAGENVRKKGIEAGSAEKPSKAAVLCTSDDRCEVAKWLYE